MAYSQIRTLQVLIGRNQFPLTFIDTMINLVEIARIFEKSSDHVAMGFEHTLFSQYPQPMQVIHDNGGEFTGFDF